jgi:hypothetical protein
MAMTVKTAATILALMLGSTLTPAQADDACTDFKWDVAKERALFAGAAQALDAGADGATAPHIELNRLYELKLKPQAQVRFAAAPGKKNPVDGAYAGLASLKIPQSGSYRVAIDAAFWIDIVSNGALVAAKDFQGQHGCNSPHKIVEFELNGTHPFILQLSDAAAESSVRLTITPTPVRVR